MGAIELMRKKALMMESAGEYAELKYLQSSGHQYISTGITPNDIYYGFKVFFEHTYLSPGNEDDWTVINISSISFDHPRYGISGIYYYGGAQIRGPFTSRETELPIGMEMQDVNVVYEIEYNIRGDLSVSINNVTTELQSGDYVEYKKTWGIFAFPFNDGVGRYAHAKVHGETTFYHNAQVIGRYLPRLRLSDNKPGMLDLVSGEFFVNQGTGEFGYETLDGTIVAPI